jgi:hypothetical protein
MVTLTACSNSRFQCVLGRVVRSCVEVFGDVSFCWYLLPCVVLCCFRVQRQLQFCLQLHAVNRSVETVFVATLSAKNCRCPQLTRCEIQHGKLLVARAQITACNEHCAAAFFRAWIVEPQQSLLGQRSRCRHAISCQWHIFACSSADKLRGGVVPR